MRFLERFGDPSRFTKHRPSHLSNEKNWLFRVYRVYIILVLPSLCGDSFINHDIKIHIKQPIFHGK